MIRPVELASIGFPNIDPPIAPPPIPVTEYERRLEAMWAATDLDWLVVYGDPEHRGNLTYLCGLDPRFEEAVLVIGEHRRSMLVGTEGRDFAARTPVAIDLLWVPAFSCAGVDRGAGLTIAEAISSAGIAHGDRVGVVGWKTIGTGPGTSSTPLIAAPSFIVDAVRAAAGSGGRVTDATDLLLDARTGQRLEHGADQIAFFEWGVSHAAAAISGIIRSARPGMTEADLARGMRYSGVPLSYHPAVASGPDLPAVLGSPGGRVVQLGEPVFAMVGVWGGNCARGGLLGAGESDDRPDGTRYLEEVAAPYWRTVVTWYESVRLDRSADDIRKVVVGACHEQGFHPALGIGHCVDWEDWPATPFEAGSAARIRSGMILDCDIFSDQNGPAHVVHCEDTIATADEALRAELAERYPEVWQRFAARQEFMRGRLGIELPDEILPLSPMAGYLPPFWLSPDVALRTAIT